MMLSVLLVILACQVPEQGLSISISKARGVGMNLESLTLASKNATTTFEQFVQKHGRTYQPGTKEYQQRQALFEARLAEITHHNSKASRRWTATVNKLADRTPEELKMLRGWDGAVRPGGASASTELYSGETKGKATVDADGKETGLSYATQAIAAQSKLRARASHDAPEAALPECVSWTNLEAMQKENILDQASCGSCWAFAASKTLQAHSEIYQHFRTFSTEQVVSCTKNPRHCGGDGGCQGATAEMAFEYVLGVGVETDEEIPYIGAERVCKTEKYHDNGPYSSALSNQDGNEMHSISDASAAKAGGGAFGMTGWMKLKENSLVAVKSALVNYGPLAVSVSAGYGWNLYGTGILAPEDCPKDAVIDHAVTLVGYGKDGSAKYWRILNSWGPEWGEDGFIRIMMTDTEDDYCGMDNQPQMGTACEGETEPVKVCGMCGVLYDTSLPIFAGDGKAAKKAALDMCS